MKVKGRLLIILFTAVLIMPVLAYPLISPFLDTTNYENRTLAEFPSLDAGFFDGLTTWFNDHLPYKNELVSLHSNLFVSLFNTTPNPRVVVGEDGWLFYNNYDAENPIDDILGRTEFSPEEIRTIEKNLNEAGESSDEKGMTFIFLLAPNKESIYREQLPDYLRDIAVDRTRADALINEIDPGKSIVVYPKDDLIREKGNRQLYYKYDTHWNKLGAYVGFRSLCQTTGISLPELSELTVHKEEGYPKDLADLAGIGNRYNDDAEYVIDDFRTEVTVKKESVGSIAVYTSDADTDKTVLFVHDSFYRSMVDYLPKVFTRVISVDRDYSDLYSVQEYIDEYQPDIVIMEVVERGIKILLHENMPY